MTDDFVKRLREAERQYVNNEYNLHARAADRIEELEAALFGIYVAPNDQPFIKSQIDAVFDVNEYRQNGG